MNLEEKSSRITDTATGMMNLDLVISAGVVVAHLAGAPGLAAASVLGRLAPDGRSGRQQSRRDLCHTAG
jgi:hypothetical protein